MKPVEDVGTVVGGLVGSFESSSTTAPMLGFSSRYVSRAQDMGCEIRRSLWPRVAWVLVTAAAAVVVVVVLVVVLVLGLAWIK